MPVVDRTYVRDTVVRAVENMEWSVTLDLGLRAPGQVPWTEIRFVPGHKLSRKRRVWGTFSPTCYGIELATRMGEAMAAETCAHELRHLWQRLNWDAQALGDMELKEADCDWYQWRAMERFWNPYKIFQRPERALGITMEAA